MSLPLDYRFQVKNDTTETIADGVTTIKVRRFKFDSAGARVFEVLEGTVFSTAGAITNGSFLDGAAQDNSVDLYDGLHAEVTTTVPGTPDGNLTVFLQRSTDGGVTFDDDGLGERVCTINFTAATTKVKSFEV